MSTVLTFLRAGTSFDPTQLDALCKAYDKALETLQMKDKPQFIKDALAAEIIALASTGECDADRLCATTLERIARWH